MEILDYDQIIIYNYNFDWLLNNLPLIISLIALIYSIISSNLRQKDADKKFRGSLNQSQSEFITSVQNLQKFSDKTNENIEKFYTNTLHNILSDIEYREDTLFNKICLVNKDYFYSLIYIITRDPNYASEYVKKIQEKYKKEINSDHFIKDMIKSNKVSKDKFDKIIYKDKIK